MLRIALYRPLLIGGLRVHSLIYKAAMLTVNLNDRYLQRKKIDRFF